MAFLPNSKRYSVIFVDSETNKQLYTVTTDKLKKLTVRQRLKLLKMLLNSFHEVWVTGLYSSMTEINPTKDIYNLKSKKQADQHRLGCLKNDERENTIIISTDITTG